MSNPDASSRVARLAVEAADAARVRALTTHPDVVALRVERVRTQVDALLWAGIVLGLAFTAVNVQHFAADGAPVGSLPWLTAWLLDPMVSLVLLAVLRAEQVTARYQVELPPWARRTKWLTFAATYVMNTWTAWGLDGGPLSPSGVVLHSVPPLVVFATAETGPGLRDRLTEAVRAALTEHATTAAVPADDRVDAEPLDTVALPAVEEAVREPVHRDVHGEVREAVHEPGPADPVNESTNTDANEPSNDAVNAPGATAPQRSRARHPARPRKATKTRKAPRRLLGEYIADARAALAAAEARGERVEVTPTWARRATGCSAGTSVKVAAALRTPAPVPAAAEEVAA